MSNQDVFTDNIQDQIVKKAKYYVNLEQHVIIITEDKLKLSLESLIKRLVDLKAWIGPVSICLTMIVVFITSDFKDFGLSKDVWKAIFFLLMIGSGLFSIIKGINALIIKFYHKESLDKTISEMKKQTIELIGDKQEKAKKEEKKRQLTNAST